MSPARASSASGSIAASSTNARNASSVRARTAGHWACPRSYATLAGSAFTKRSERVDPKSYLGDHSGWRMTSGCLTENDVQALLDGALPTGRVDGVEVHLDACLKCQLLVSAGVRTTSLRTHGLEAEPVGRVHFDVGQVLSN